MVKIAKLAVTASCDVAVGRKTTMPRRFSAMMNMKSVNTKGKNERPP